MSENNQNNLLPNMPQSGPVDVKTVVGYGTLYGCAIANVGGSIKAPTYVVNSLAKYGMQSRFAGRRYGTVVGAVCFGGLTAAHACLHNWRIQNRSIPENAWVNYTGLLGTASGAFIGLTSFPGTTFLKGARNGIIGALVGFAIHIPLGIFVERYMEVKLSEEEGDMEHGIGAIEKELEVQG